LAQGRGGGGVTGGIAELKEKKGRLMPQKENEIICGDAAPTAREDAA